MRLSTIEEMRAYYAKDEFAHRCLGATVDEYEEGRAVCSMSLDDRHHNAQGFIMGGVIFSLADFALAVCSNTNQPDSCAVTNTIDFMNRVKGERLIATATADKPGRTMGFFRVDVHDEMGTYVARMNATCFRTEKPY